MIQGDRFLLLGANDEETMHLLTVPHSGRVPKIRTLPLSFAEAKLRLEKEWEIQRTLKQKERDQCLIDSDSEGESDNGMAQMEIDIYCPPERSAERPETRGEPPDHQNEASRPRSTSAT